MQCCGRIRIRIHRIHVFLASWILLSLSKNIKKNLDLYCFVISFWLFTFEKWCKSTFENVMDPQHWFCAYRFLLVHDVSIRYVYLDDRYRYRYPDSYLHWQRLPSRTQIQIWKRFFEYSFTILEPCLCFQSAIKQKKLPYGNLEAPCYVFKITNM